MKEEKHDEKWLLSRGWNKYKGYKVDHDQLAEGDYTFFESVSDFATKCTYYTQEEGELGYDDLDSAIEFQEEQDDWEENHPITKKDLT